MSINMWDKYWGEEKNSGFWTIPADEVLDFISICNLETHNEVLDLGCGLGRHSIAFADAGFDVTATDLSETAIEKLNGIANKHRLPILGILADYNKRIFANERFDIVISYNVIYHGSRDSFQGAIDLCYDYLRLGGVLFFTCPTRNDGKYGSGRKAAVHTYESLNSVHPGNIHYFADEDDVNELCSGFSTVDLVKKEHWWDHNGTKQFASYWVVKAKK